MMLVPKSVWFPVELPRAPKSRIHTWAVWRKNSNHNNNQSLPKQQQQQQDSEIKDDSILLCQVVRNAWEQLDVSRRLQSWHKKSKTIPSWHHDESVPVSWVYYKPMPYRIKSWESLNKMTLPTITFKKPFNPWHPGINHPLCYLFDLSAVVKKKGGTATTFHGNTVTI